MSSISEKGKTILKWCPSDDYRKTYDRIFKKDEKTEEEASADNTSKQE